MEKNNILFKIVSNTIAQSIGKIISAGLSFINIALLTRYLGTSGYGNYTLVFSYLAFFSLISDFGLQFVGVKEIASSKTETGIIYGTLFRLKLYLVILSSLLALIFLIFFPYNFTIKNAVLIGIVAVSFSGLTGYFNTIFQARVRLDLLTLIDLLGRLVSVISVVLFVFYQFNFYFIISSVLIGNLCSFIIGAILLPETIKKSFDKQIALKLLKQSVPIGFTALLSTLYFKIDTIILSLLKSSYQVGIYSLAYKILENVVLFWFFYVSSIYPLLARFKAEDSIKYYKLMKQSFTFSIIVSIPIMLVSYFLAPIIVFIFAGAKFEGSISALRILLFSLPFILINTLFYNFFILEEFNIVIILGMIISLIFNVTLNLIYIPRFGYISAAYITILSEIILVIVYLLGLAIKKAEVKQNVFQ